MHGQPHRPRLGVESRRQAETGEAGPRHDGPAGLAARARVVLLAADGLANYEIAELVGMTRPTVNRWRSRYAERGIAGLADEQRPGRPKTVDQAKIISATLTPPPKSLGVTHWSSRLLAPRLGVDHTTVAGGRGRSTG